MTRMRAAAAADAALIGLATCHFIHVVADVDKSQPPR